MGNKVALVAELPTIDNPAMSVSSLRLHECLAKGTLAAAAELTPKDLPELLDYKRECERLLVYSTPTQIAEELVVLFSFYPAQKLPESVGDAKLKLWLNDLRELPYDVLKAACATWRRSTEKFAPSPGQLLSTVDPIMSIRRGYYRRVASVIEIINRQVRADA
jgi:hypothetical protein